MQHIEGAERQRHKFADARTAIVEELNNTYGVTGHVRVTKKCRTDDAVSYFKVDTFVGRAVIAGRKYKVKGRIFSDPDFPSAGTARIGDLYRFWRKVSPQELTKSCI